MEAPHPASPLSTGERGRSAFSLVALVLCIPILGAIGCQSSTKGEAVPDALAGKDPLVQLDFWHTLPERHAVSNDEAFHALAMFIDADDSGAGYGQRVRILKDRHMLPGGFDETTDGGATGAVRRGTLAVALVKALSIKGGITMHLFGTPQRYAVRELEYANVFPPSSPQQTLSGAEFLGIIGRAEDYQRGQGSGDDTKTDPEEMISATGSSDEAPAPAGESGQ